jgi:hypothetical protein
MSYATIERECLEVIDLEKVVTLTCCRQLINDQINILIADLEKRGHDDKPRKLIVQIEGVMDRGKVCLTVQVQAKMPPMKSLEITGKLQKDNDGYSLLFGPDADSEGGEM